MIKNNLGSYYIHLCWFGRDINFLCVANFSYKNVALSFKYACTWNNTLSHNERTRNRIGACVVPPLVSHISMYRKIHASQMVALLGFFLETQLFFWSLHFKSYTTCLLYERPKDNNAVTQCNSTLKKNSQKGKLIITLWGKINQLRDGRLYSQVNLSQN